MEAHPKLGSRFLIPSNSQLSSKFIEMRRIGNYPEDIVLAFLYAYFERILENNEDLHQVSIRLKGNQNLIPKVEEFIQLLEGKVLRWPDTSYRAQSDSLQIIEDLSRFLQTELSLTFNNDYHTIKAIDTLCRLFKCSCKFIYLAPNTADFQIRREMVTGEEYTKPVLFMCAGVQNFILYNRLTLDSFANLSCGCLTLNYFLYRSVAEQARGETVSHSDIARFKIQCRSCPQRVSADDLNLIFLHIPPSSTQTFRLQTKTEKCSHTIERGIVCLGCGLLICADCAVMRALTPSGPTCPGCDSTFLAQLMASSLVQKYEWAESILKIVVESQPLPPNPFYLSPSAKTPNHLHQSSYPEDLSRSRSAPPVHSNHETATEEQKSDDHPPSYVEKYQPKKCLKCNQDIKHSLCSRGCLCVSCELQQYYSKLNPDSKCSICHEKLKEYFNSEATCNICKKKLKRKELAYVCAACYLQVCYKCSKSQQKAVLMCPASRKSHDLCEDKMKAIAKVGDTDCNTF